VRIEQRSRSGVERQHRAQPRLVRVVAGAEIGENLAQPLLRGDRIVPRQRAVKMLRAGRVAQGIGRFGTCC